MYTKNKSKFVVGPEKTQLTGIFKHWFLPNNNEKYLVIFQTSDIAC